MRPFWPRGKLQALGAARRGIERVVSTRSSLVARHPVTRSFPSRPSAGCFLVGGAGHPLPGLLSIARAAGASRDAPPPGDSRTPVAFPPLPRLLCSPGVVLSGVVSARTAQRPTLPRTLPQGEPDSQARKPARLPCRPPHTSLHSEHPHPPAVD